MSKFEHLAVLENRKPFHGTQYHELLRDIISLLKASHLRSRERGQVRFHLTTIGYEVLTELSAIHLQ